MKEKAIELLALSEVRWPGCGVSQITMQLLCTVVHIWQPVTIITNEGVWPQLWAREEPLPGSLLDQNCPRVCEAATSLNERC